MRSTLDPATETAADIASAIADAITGAEFNPGDKLPSETDLAQHFKVSRPTIREALSRLAGIGLTTKKRGAHGGTFVQEVSSDRVAQTIARQIGLLAGTDTTSREAAVELITAGLTLARSGRVKDGPEPVDINDLLAEMADNLDQPVQFANAQRIWLLNICDRAANPMLRAMAKSAVIAGLDMQNRAQFTQVDRSRLLAVYARIAEAIGSKDQKALARFLADLGALFSPMRRSRPDQ